MYIRTTGIIGRACAARTNYRKWGANCGEGEYPHQSVAWGQFHTSTL